MYVCMYVSLSTKAGAYGSCLEGYFLFIRKVKLWSWKEEKYENAFWVQLLAKYVIDDNLINALGSALFRLHRIHVPNLIEYRGEV